MIRFSILIIISFVSSLTFGQALPDGVDLKVSDPFSTASKRLIEEIVSHKDGKIFAYNRSWIDNQIEFLIFDENLNLLQKNVVKLKIGKSELDFIKIIETKEGFYVFYMVKDLEMIREVLYYQEIDMNNLTLLSPKILHSKGYNIMGGSLAFRVEVSENKEFLMVEVSSSYSAEKKDFGLESFDVLVFDKNFDRVWREDNVSLVETGDRMFRNKRMVTNNGEVIMMVLQLAGDVEEMESTEDVLEMLSYYVVVLGKDKEHVMYELKPESGYFADLNFKLGSDGNLFIVCVSYDNDEDERNWYFFEVDLEKGSFVVENKSKFKDTPGFMLYQDDPDDEMVKLVRESPFIQNETKLKPDILIDNIFLNKESVTVTFKSSVDVKTIYKLTTYVGAGVVKFDQEGNQIWNQGVQKIQYDNYNGSQFVANGVLYSDGDVSFVFNFTPMEITNGNLNNTAWAYNSASDLYIATISNDGDLSVNLLLKGGRRPFWIPTTEYRSTDELIIYGYNGKSKLAKISMNNK